MNTQNNDDTDVFTISICGVKAVLEIDKSFTQIRDLFENIKIDDPINETLPRIKISESNVRDIILDKDWKSLEIKGPKIDNLKDPFNLIGILQATTRFLSLVGISKSVVLLHGSTVVFNDKTIQFGDDGFSTAKTLSSFECALKSNKYVCDEFSFLDINSLKVPGMKYNPVHIRDIVNDYLVREHKRKFDSSDYENSTAGVFILPENIFETVLPESKLDLIIYTHFIDHGEPFYKKLDGNQAFKATQTNILAHIMKLLYPSLDRMQFKVTNDTDKRVVYNEEFVEELTDKLMVRELIEKLSQKVPSFQIYVTNPNQITKIVDEISKIY